MKQHLKLILVSGLCGLIIGSCLTMITGKVLIHRAFRHGPRKAHFQKRLVHKLERKLSLDEEQKKKVEEIISSRHEKIHAALKEGYPVIKGHVESGITEIESILTDDQKEKWKDIKGKLQKHRNRFESRFLEN
jgi:hypothetical protein